MINIFLTRYVLNTYMYVPTYLHMYVRKDGWMDVHTYVCMYVCVYLYVYLCVCVFVL